MSREMLMRRARNWVERNNCPLPLDLAVECMAAGIDVTAFESNLLFDDATDRLNTNNEG